MENPQQPRFQPFIPAGTSMREFTVRAVVWGAVLGMLFGASSLYLVLKVGLTVSASIPVAVIALALFRTYSKFGGRDATILENNITQTAGSAGESLAFGVGVTMPAIMILGFDLDLTRVLLVSILGGALGILMMIPLRRALIVKEHGFLKYPEGTACAAVLTAGASAQDREMASPEVVAEMRRAEAAGLGKAPGAKAIFTGLSVGIGYNVLNRVLRLWKDTPERDFGPPYDGASVSAEISPELLGIGYVIGPRIASLMCGGGVLSYLVLIPMIKFFGGHLADPLAPGKTLISQMGPDDVRSAYVLYIGSGAVAAGGIVSLIRSLPTIWHGLKEGLKDIGFARSGGAAQAASVPRTDRDLSMKFVGIGCVILMAAIMLAPSLLDAGIAAKVLGAILIVIFGFLFVTVSSRLTGEIGSSSNPISGMTIAALLLTCLIFILVGWTGSAYYVTALSVGAIVCIASSNGGSTSQDLKTGFLLGATPRHLQVAILIGSFASALFLGPILLKLNSSQITYVPVAEVAPADLHVDPSTLTASEALAGPQSRGDHNTYLVWHRSDPSGGAAEKYLVDRSGKAVWLVDQGINGTHEHRPDGTLVKKFQAPKAVLISYIIKGILGHKLPWSLVLLGVMISLVLEMSGVPSLAFAVGIYLPLSSSTPIWAGGLIRMAVDRYTRLKHAGKNLTEEQLVEEGDKSPGVLLASGYIAGGALAGIVIAILQGVPSLSDFDSRLNDWAMAHNPVFNGPHADSLSMLFFCALCLFLYLVGKEAVLRPKAAPPG
ncbi:MAG TPA: oligopeptide transporter, OPT family [Opitutaceae bacterium]|jgi:putative OPT family oligopeptide transporter